MGQRLTPYSFGYFLHFICLLIFFCVFMCVGAHGTACVCRSEDKVQGSVLTFQHVSPGDGIWVIGINVSHCYLLSNLALNHSCI